MATTIVAATNSSLEIETNGRYPTIDIETPYVGQDLLFDEELYEFVYSNGYQFLSCYAESYLTFEFYWMPFKPTLWIGFFASMTLTFIVFYIYMIWKYKQLPFSIWLSFVSILFDDFSSVPKMVGKSLFYRLIFAAWGPVSLLFTNCYSGLMISELNAPLKQTRSQNFEDLICLNRHVLDLPASSIDIRELAKTLRFKDYRAYWGKIDYGFNALPTLKNHFVSNNCYRILSPPSQRPWMFSGVATYVWHFHRIVHFLEFTRLLSETGAANNFIRDELITLLLMNPVHAVFPIEFDQTRLNYSTTELAGMVETDVINCGTRIAFVATSETLQGEMNFLSKKYPSKRFHTSQRLLVPTWKGWSFKGGGRSTKRSSVSAVQRNFRVLVHSGIYSR
ncbi:hypothetical protein Fcan01_19288 [Folsomia candida]|uniref:Uncharacterized protein n=1 Tax=Folsomia candida TaxID=158441 RepID=A0A226DLV4_FOLCA|nr:hypothetical protein Fcan01_19288 [Folsomia candida]